MKIIGTKKKGRHLKKNRHGGEKAGTVRKAEKHKKRRISTGVKIAVGILVVVTALGLGAMAYLKLSDEPPPVKGLTPVTPSGLPSETNDPAEPTDSGVQVDNASGARDDKKYTFVVFGTDDGNGNTDVIMVATLDVSDYTLNVVNIPRDTLVNVSWTPKKVNTLYAVMKGGDGAIDKLKDILGYELDFYIVVDLEAFSALIDAIGGVNFNVPRNMKYSDPAQNLYIDISKGQQTLNGAKALQLVRFRSGYASADIGRIEMTQQFLLAAAAQILENKDSISPTSMASIFLKYVKTNLKLNHVIWFAKELLKLNAEDITFTLLPANTNDSVNGESYVTIHVDDWLKIINEKLNPFTVPITLDNLSIYTRNSGGSLYVTNGVYAGKSSWGNNKSSSSGSSASGGSSSGSSGTAPAPTATAAPAPTAIVTPSPSPAASPEVTGAQGAEPPVSELPPGENELVTPTPESVPVTPTPEVLTPPPATPPDEGTLFFSGII